MEKTDQIDSENASEFTRKYNKWGTPIFEKYCPCCRIDISSETITQRIHILAL